MAGEASSQGVMRDLRGEAGGGEEILRRASQERQTGDPETVRLSRLEKGAERPPASHVKVNEGFLETTYSFRGPRSHRPVFVVVPHAYWMAIREEKALKVANSLMLLQELYQIIGEFKAPPSFLRPVI